MPRKKCPHGRLQYRCKECGGVSICEHKRRRSACKECGGSEICEHKRERSKCKECGGGNLCEHNCIRGRCKECGGSQICEHSRRRTQCKECGGSEICAHNRMRNACVECDGSQVCDHKRIKYQCWLCSPARYAKEILRLGARTAKKRGYAPPDITPEKLVKLLSMSKRCALCSGLLNWTGKRPALLHHNHETGRVIGFVHSRCNKLEGTGKSGESQHFREITYIDPQVSDVIIGGVYANGSRRGEKFS